MLKAVFRPNELVPLPDKITIDSPNNYPDLIHLKTIEEPEDILDDVEEYTGPTADDLRREAELFKVHWEEEKERMISNAKEEAENIISEAENTASREVKRQTDEGQALKQQAEEEAQRIIADANAKSLEIENEMRQSLDAEKKQALDKGFTEGCENGFADGKAEVDRLIERTQTVLERVQNKRAEILKESEKEIVDLVLLITRKVVKVISENQRDIIIANVREALRKIRSKGDIIIRVNLADLQLTTEHKQYFIELMEGANSVNIIEDSTVDKGGCIVETDFGEIDARIASQLAELESKILEISPVESVKENTPVPVFRTVNLKADLQASTEMLRSSDILPPLEPAKSSDRGSEPELYFDPEQNSGELSTAANAALTASAALAALTTMAVKGKRESDHKIVKGLEKIVERRS